MKIKHLAGIILGLLVAVAAIEVASANPDAILGKWLAKDLDNSIIQVKSQEDGSVVGTIIESSNEAYLGVKILYDCKYIAEAGHYKSVIYSPARKMEIDATISLESDKKLKVVGRKLFLTKTFYWKRI